jgi:hypothetical protein
MLKEVAGDILLTKAEVLAHGVAPNDNFANGCRKWCSLLISRRKATLSPRKHRQGSPEAMPPVLL